MSKTKELKKPYGVCHERIVTSVLEAVSRRSRLSFQRETELGARTMMSRGLRSSLSRLSAAAPAILHSIILSGSSAGMEELYGSVMPSASIADAIVLAVYMPPHAPAPGHELRTVSKRAASSALPDTNSPAFA